VKILIEVDVEILDPTWEKQTVRENLPDYLGTAIDVAEQTGRDFRGDDGPYVVDTSNLTIWTSHEDYAAEMAERKAAADTAHCIQRHQLDELA
jgi:hypothetical protein